LKPAYLANHRAVFLPIGELAKKIRRGRSANSRAQRPTAHRTLTGVIHHAIIRLTWDDGDFPDCALDLVRALSIPQQTKQDRVIRIE
jgi:hypothetical protein